jgi:alkylation response protein AidB-like acyl-CoA dehydrogenase
LANFYLDNPDIEYLLRRIDLSEVSRLRERGFAEADEYDHAPSDADDALENYLKVLKLIGDIAGTHIAPRAEEVDKEGAQCSKGEVCYAPGTLEALKMLSDAELMGMTLPRRYGGLNFPVTVYAAAIEIVSRADAALMTIFGLQDIAETINSFADEELKEKYLPKFSAGEVTGAMVLTEPDAGSDLQAVMLQATEDPQQPGLWRLNGVKRFITNGCGDVLLVLGRSEPNTTDGRGLSLYVCEKGPSVRIRRIENKLGIKGSPTCEIQFCNTPAYLIGKRRRGLTLYVMDLMNGARLAIASQGLGIAQAAFVAAKEFAEAREQFGKKIRDIPAVRNMLVEMKMDVEASRALVYETARIVDLADGLEIYRDSGAVTDKEKLQEIRAGQGKFSKYASLLTPMSKHFACEKAVAITSTAIQVHGGSGYMKDYDVERYYRDARITTIYEGTTELQVVAAMGGILNGTFEKFVDELDASLGSSADEDLRKLLREAFGLANECTEFLKSSGDSSYTDLHARELVELAMDVINGYLLLRLSKDSPHKQAVAKRYIRRALPRAHMLAGYVKSGDRITLDEYETIVD